MSPFVITTALSAENNPLSLDLWNILFHMINLVILYLLLRKFLIGPLMNIMEKRRAMIADGLQNASDQQAIYSVRLSEADEVGLCLRHCILAGDMLSFVADNPRYGATAFDMQRTNFVPIVGRVVRMIRSYDDLNRYFVG